VKSATQIEIPKFLSHLKTYGGYPVPLLPREVSTVCGYVSQLK
jgi:hypothetical protein